MSKKIQKCLCYVAGFVLSLATFGWFALAGIKTVTKQAVGSVSKSQTTTMSVYELLRTENLKDMSKTSIVFAIIAMVLAILLAIACIIAILNALDVIKLDWFKFIVGALGFLFMAAAIVAMACMAKFGTDNSGSLGLGQIEGSIKVTCGAGLVLTFVSSLLALGAVGYPLFIKADKKPAPKKKATAKKK